MKTSSGPGPDETKLLPPNIGLLHAALPVAARRVLPLVLQESEMRPVPRAMELPIAEKPDSLAPVRPVDIQQIGDELAIKWDDATESFITLEKLRRHCPCAGCKGEMDIMGNVYRNPTKPLPARAFELRRLGMVGDYAVQPVWGDGHSTGLFAFDYLRKVATLPDPDQE